MPAYMLVRVDVSDMRQYQQYMQVTPAILAKYGGKFLVRGGDKIVLEGPPAPERIVLLEFDSVAAARRMYASPEYQAALQLRQGAAKASFIVMEGMEGLEESG